MSISDMGTCHKCGGTGMVHLFKISEPCRRCNVGGFGGLAAYDGYTAAEVRQRGQANDDALFGDVSHVEVGQ